MADECLNSETSSGLYYFNEDRTELKGVIWYFPPYTNCKLGKLHSSSLWNGFIGHALHFGNQYGQFSYPWYNALNSSSIWWHLRNVSKWIFSVRWDRRIGFPRISLATKLHQHQAVCRTFYSKPAWKNHWTVEPISWRWEPKVQFWVSITLDATSHTEPSRNILCHFIFFIDTCTH